MPWAVCKSTAFVILYYYYCSTTSTTCTITATTSPAIDYDNIVKTSVEENHSVDLLFYFGKFLVTIALLVKRCALVQKPRVNYHLIFSTKAYSSTSNIHTFAIS